MKTIPEIKLWKELGITSCTMEFSCGGDSMNDYNFTFYKTNNKKGKNQPAVIQIECQELTDYFDNQVFREVEFYEAATDTTLVKVEVLKLHLMMMKKVFRITKVHKVNGRKEQVR